MVKIMNRLEKAREFRNRINANLQATRKLIRVDELDENELLEMIDLYESYQVGKSYKVDDIFKYEGKLYKVIPRTHFTRRLGSVRTTCSISKPMPENVIPEWVQPTGSHDAYNVGDKVIYEGEVYESIIDSNTWSPTDYPQGWEEV